MRLDVEVVAEQRVVGGRSTTGYSVGRQHLRAAARATSPRNRCPRSRRPTETRPSAGTRAGARPRLVQAGRAHLGHHDERTLEQHVVGQPEQPVIGLAAGAAADRGLGQLGQPDRRLMSARGQSTFQPPSAPPRMSLRNTMRQKWKLPSASCGCRQPRVEEAGAPNCASTLAAASARVSRAQDGDGATSGPGQGWLPGSVYQPPPGEARPSRGQTTVPLATAERLRERVSEPR